MFQVMVLVCAISITPAECQTNTAIKTLRGPEAANEVECGLYGQVYFAQMGQHRLTKGQYLKIMCTRTSSERSLARTANHVQALERSATGQTRPHGGRCGMSALPAYGDIGWHSGYTWSDHMGKLVATFD